MQIRRAELAVTGASVVPSPKGGFAKMLERLKESAIAPQIERWNRMERALERAERQLGKEGRMTVELQLMAQRLSVEAQLTAAAGEAVSGIFKRLNQLAGGG